MNSRRLFFMGLASALLFPMSDAEARKRKKKSAKARRRSSAGAGGTSFRSCADARANGYSRMREGEPGYSRRLDRDGDGIACE